MATGRFVGSSGPDAGKGRTPIGDPGGGPGQHKTPDRWSWRDGFLWRKRPATSMLNIQSNIDAFERSLTAFERQQLPFAVSLAINETLEDVKREEERLLPVRLDRPTAFTQRGLAIRRSSKRRLIGSVFFKSIQSEYLRKVEEGGIRKPKGKAIPVPVRQRVNKYGNLPKGAIRRLLAKPNVFSGNVKGVGGIWQRMKGGKLKLLVAYERQASYRPQLKFQQDARATAIRRIGANMHRAMMRAIQTAR